MLVNLDKKSLEEPQLVSSEVELLMNLEVEPPMSSEEQLLMTTEVE